MRSLTLPENSPGRRRSALLAAFTALLTTAGMLAALDFASAPARAATPANTAVTTHRNDNEHDGQYADETILNTSDVNAAQFGKRVQYPVDGQTYAQPLYLPNVTIGGAVHDVVYAATENDSVYAFDADADTTAAPAPLWHVSLLPAGAKPVPNSFDGCGDLQPVIGITGTPVIDPATNTMFVVSYDQENGNEVYHLHALDITTGADRWPSVVIAGSTPGTGAGSSGGNVAFDAAVERQRSALVLANGRIYVAFSSFCDIGDYHGFIFGYSYANSAFSVADVYDDTPNGGQAGLWGGAAALSADASGNLYYTSGNGTFDADGGGADMGQSFVKLNASLQRTDYFAPFVAKCGGDNDLGAGGPLVIPSANEVIGAGKEGRPYVVSTTNMGGFTADPNLGCNGGTDYDRTDIDKIVQEMPPGTLGSIFSTPGFYNGPNGQYVYFSENGGPTVAYSFSGGRLSAAPVSRTPESFGGTGGDAVASSDGTASGTGIVWMEGGDSVLRAYDATNLGTELYNSRQNASRDGISGYVKFSSAVVTNGQVFVGLSSSLAVFGELSASAPPPLPNGIKISAGGPAAAPFVADTDFSGGSASGTAHAIDTSGVTGPAPQSVYQNNRFGTFSYSVGGLPTTGSYTVRLHFAEEYWTAPGARTFNVILNGTQVLTDFDIFATAGAEYRAVVEQFDVAANGGGRVTLQFTTVKDNAQVNGIEIDPSTSTTTPPTTTPPPAALRINAGGPAVAPFAADEDSAGGAAAAVTDTIDLSGVTDPAPMAVYQTNRYGDFTYTIPGYAAGSSHTVRLDFAEEYWTAAGSRIFDVAINGTRVLTDFDILAAAGGEYRAVDEQFTTAANGSGQIVIQFTTVKDNAQVNGIEIS